MSRAATALLCTAGIAHAQQFPSKPIKVIVPFPPGGPTDLTVRPVGQKMHELFGQPIVMEHRAGAAGVIAAEAVARAPADGYTLLIISTAFTIMPSTFAKLPFDAARDFVGVGLLATSDILLVTNPSVPVRTVKELISLARAQPNKFTYGSSGTGGPLHLAGELLMMETGIRMTHVPYKGAAPALMDTIGGHVDLMFISIPPALAQAKAGKVRVIAVASAKRAAGYPEAPTFAEAGFPGFEVDSRYGLLAPAATPRDTINKLNAALGQILRSPEIRDIYSGLGLEPASIPSEQYTSEVRRDMVKWKKVVDAAKLKPQ
jgi:tripartite-type tricarboxylate transporter receptor subunit TctC